MSTSWDKLQTLPNHVQQKIQNLYSELFPIEVRYCLSKWLEGMNCWDDYDTDNPTHEDYLNHTVLPAMFGELEKTMATSDMAMRFRLNPALMKMRNAYAQNPYHLVRVIKHCLQEEGIIVRQFESGVLPVDDGFTAKHSPSIDDQIEYLKSLRDDVQQTLPQLKQEHEHLVLNFSNFKKQYEFMNQGNVPADQWNKVSRDRSVMEEKLKKMAAGTARNRNAWLEKFDRCWSAMNEMLKKVVDEDLERWKRDQQLGGNIGRDVSQVTLEKTLCTLQGRCEILADILWSSYQQLQAFEVLCREGPLSNTPAINEKVPQLKHEVQAQLHKLIQSTFLIEKQPPQVMKTNTRFAATVRFLVGVRLNVHMSSPQVRVTIISESIAKAFINSNGKTVESSGEILNYNGLLEYHSGTNQLTANFRNLQLKKIKRTEKKGTESVMDEKFALLFQTSFKIANGEFTYAVNALSLPVVVIVHGNQEPHAWATVTWDNAFATPNRLPFNVPDKVPWPRVGEVLSMKFKSYVGRDLSADAQRFLAAKAFRNPSLVEPLDHMQLTWAQFAKEALPDRNFTLWEWFYALLKVTKEHMRNLWIDGTILGFISRKQTEEMLLQCQPGTFLLRFSDTELGGVTIAWLGENPDGSPEVYMLQPFTSRDFSIRGLADRISDLQNLVYLYPNIPKEHAFGKYYTPLNDRQTLPNGYVKHALALTLPGMNNGNGSIDFPNTPPSNLGFNPHSPESTSYHDPGSVPSVVNDYMPGASGSTVPEDILDLVDNMDFDINDLESILSQQ